MKKRIKKKKTFLGSFFKRKVKPKKKKLYPSWLIQIGWICVLLISTFGLVTGITFWGFWWNVNQIYFNLAFI